MHGGNIYDKQIQYDFSVNINPYAHVKQLEPAMDRIMKEISNYPDPKQAEFRKAISKLEGIDEKLIWGGNGASELFLAIVRHLMPRQALVICPSFYGYRHALQAVGCEISEYALRPADSGISEYPLRSADSEISEYALRPADSGISEYPLRSADSGISEYPLWSADSEIMEYPQQPVGSRIPGYSGWCEGSFRLTGDILHRLTDPNLPKPDLLFLANPNNPTGLNVGENLLSRIIEICHQRKIPVVIDECFLRLSDHPKSCKQLVEKYDNLYVVDAFTKLFAIPGARVGFVCTCRENIEGLKRQLPEWNMSVPAQILGTECARQAAETDFVRQSVDLIRRERSFLETELKRLSFSVFPSDTNFLLFSAERDLYHELLKKGILIRDCSDYRGLRQGFYRIAVKDRSSNRALLTALQQLKDLNN